jgi:hypothetical protein
MIMMNWAIIIVPVCLLFGNKQLVSADILKITVAEVVVHAGKSSVIKMEIEIKEGYHIQANKVKDDLLIPATIEINEDKNITTGRQEFPSAKKFKLEGTDDFLDVFDGVFEIRIPFKTIEKIPKGKYILNAKLHYQACDNRTCLFPKSIRFSIPLKII